MYTRICLLGKITHFIHIGDMRGVKCWKNKVCLKDDTLLWCEEGIYRCYCILRSLEEFKIVLSAFRNCHPLWADRCILNEGRNLWNFISFINFIRFYWNFELTTRTKHPFITHMYKFSADLQFTHTHTKTLFFCNYLLFRSYSYQTPVLNQIILLLCLFMILRSFSHSLFMVFCCFVSVKCVYVS